MSLCLQLLCLVVATFIYKVAITEAFGLVAYNDSSECVVYKALPACFGPQLPAEGLEGHLIRAVPANACHTMLNPPAPRKVSETYIVLIQGCDCPYAEKVLRAQQAGYQAAVVYNVDSEELMAMMSDDREIQQQIEIPSLFTGESVSLHLQKTSQCEKGPYVRLIPPKYNLCLHQSGEKMLQSAHILSKLRDLLYIIVATISAMVGISWWRNAHKIRLYTYRQGDQYEICVICMSEYKEGDLLKILPCSHTYHHLCIDTWFDTQSRKKTCPFCKQQVDLCRQAELLQQQRSENGAEEIEEEQGHDDDTFRDDYEDECVEEEGDNESINGMRRL
ncbi:E3 ubiquitin-protein ligase RNF13-like [Lagopus leucura]|uniref:E3 ubiquitin-protein ligase RNF13-like n=1 Tax=Lagopus leucura TaxID=30410 RepID=UPI001C67A5D2|nr:E3 ubiquitin-protein ligase RNF13-like [Lagopus leucura]